jgi:hypothetical protein
MPPGTSPALGDRVRDHSGGAPYEAVLGADGLTATAASPSQVNLASTRSTDNVGVPRYRVAPTSRCGLPAVLA